MLGVTHVRISSGMTSESVGMAGEPAAVSGGRCTGGVPGSVKGLISVSWKLVSPQTLAKVSESMVSRSSCACSEDARHDARVSTMLAAP